MVRAVLIGVLFATAASAQTVYRWTDSRGTVHYTDDPSSIPSGVKATTTEGNELSNISPQKTTPVATVIQQPGAAAMPVEVPNRADEDYWRGQFRAARQKIRELEDEVAADQARLDGPTRLGGNYYCAPGYVYGYPNGTTQQFKQSANLGAQVTAPIGGGGSLTVNGNVSSTIKGQKTFNQLAGTGYGYGGYGSPCYWLPDGESDRVRERSDRTKTALARAKEDLADLERRAAYDAVPLEWRR